MLGWASHQDELEARLAIAELAASKKKVALQLAVAELRYVLRNCQGHLNDENREKAIKVALHDTEKLIPEYVELF